MLEPLPSTELALRDTSFAHARGERFDVLARMYGLPRPTITAVTAWREALREGAQGARGTRGVWHAFLEAALGPGFGEDYTVVFDPGTPYIGTWSAGGVVAGWEARHVNRLWRVSFPDGTTQLVYSVGPSFVGGPGPVADLEFCSVATAYWQRLDVSSLGAPTAVSARLLPFLWSDFDGQVLLTLDAGAATPPTYMQPAVAWAATAAGGAVGANEALYASDSGIEPPTWKQPAGPGELLHTYVVTEETAGVWRDLSVTADIDPNDPGVLPARGGSHQVTLRKAAGFVFADTALTCAVGAAAQTAMDVVHTVALAAGDWVGILVVPGGGVTEPLRNVRVSVNITRPVGQPKGGAVLSDAAVPGDQFLGPWPLYLGDSVDASLLAALAELLAAGVHLRPSVAAFDVFDGTWGA